MFGFLLLFIVVGLLLVLFNKRLSNELVRSQASLMRSALGGDRPWLSRFERNAKTYMRLILYGGAAIAFGYVLIVMLIGIGLL